MKRSNLKRIDIVTLFPAMFEGPLSESLLGRARERGLIDLQIHNLRDFSSDVRHHSVDDRPYGGGAGMVLQAEPIFKALQQIRREGRPSFKGKGKPYVIYMSPQGKTFQQALAQELAQRPWLVFLCGHYEGIDERVLRWVDGEISIGDYVLTGGELPAMVVVDAVARWVPGVVKESSSLDQDSFQRGLLDHPHYTRPAVWRRQRVPSVLMSGNHDLIRSWRLHQSQAMTQRKRPDLAVFEPR